MCVGPVPWWCLSVGHWVVRAGALISQGSPIIPLQIGDTFSSEVILGQENVGKAMALGMVAIVAVVMTLYVVLERRTSRWLAR